MKTLIIYDKKGNIYQTITGSYLLPDGLPFIEVELPQDKVLVSVDVKNKIPVLKDLEETETQKLSKSLEEIKIALAELAELTIGGI